MIPVRTSRTGACFGIVIEPQFDTLIAEPSRARSPGLAPVAMPAAPAPQIPVHPTNYILRICINDNWKVTRQIVKNNGYA